jgi:hypothetical protein
MENKKEIEYKRMPTAEYRKLRRREKQILRIKMHVAELSKITKQLK